jgi:Protein of unknown function (DUF3306)
MTDRDNVLSRWSRRKRAAAQAAEAARAAEAAKSPPPESSSAPAFDPASLPPIESITAATDIRAFFAADVPAELTRAALRRVWTADPKIRDFVGLADYDWDFNAPGSMAGFGPLGTADALRREVAGLVAPGATEHNAPAVSEGAEATPGGLGSGDSGQDRSGQFSTVPSKDAPSPNFDALQSRDDPPQPADQCAATQREQEKSENVQQIVRRRHGGALPRS